MPPTVTAVWPVDGAVGAPGNTPVVVRLDGPSGAKTHDLIETSQADWSSGTLTDTVATPGGALELLGYHEETFAAYETGTFPSPSWSGILTSNGTITVEATGGAQALRIVSTASGSTPHAVRWVSPGTAADVDARVEWRCDDSIVGRVPGLRVRTPTTGDGLDGYLVDVTSNGTLLRLLKRVNGTGTVLASTAVSLSADTWYVFRLQAIGTTIRVKVWAQSATEPSSWTLSATDSSITAAGYVVLLAITGGVGQTIWYGTAQVIGASAAGKLYPATGTRESPVYDLSSTVAVFGDTVIAWEATTPAGTAVSVEAAVNGGEYQACANGEPIPGITYGGSASSMRLRYTLSTSDEAVTPSVAECTIRFRPITPERVTVEVNGVQCSAANGLAEYWGHRRIASGQQVDDLSTVYFGTRAPWFDATGMATTVAVRYDAELVGETAFRCSEHHDGPVVAGIWDAWAGDPSWQLGAFDATWCAVDPAYEVMSRDLAYEVIPAAEAAVDLYYLVGHRIRTAAYGGATVGELARGAAYAGATVLGRSRGGGLSGAVVQGQIRAASSAGATVGVGVRLRGLIGATVAATMTRTRAFAGATIRHAVRGALIMIEEVPDTIASWLRARGIRS